MSDGRPGAPRQPRLPIDALRGVMPNRSISELARSCGVSRRQMQRYMSEGGIPVYTADLVANRCGMHPCEVWPEWFAAAS